MKNKTLTPFAKILLSIILLIILICLIKLIFGIAYITDDYKYINSTENCFPPYCGIILTSLNFSTDIMFFGILNST